MLPPKSRLLDSQTFLKNQPWSVQLSIICNCVQVWKVTEHGYVFKVDRRTAGPLQIIFLTMLPRKSRPLDSVFQERSCCPVVYFSGAALFKKIIPCGPAVHLENIPMLSDLPYLQLHMIESWTNLDCFFSKTNLAVQWSTFPRQHC